MKRKTILGLTVGLTLFSMLFIGNSFQSLAMQQVTSAQLKNAGRQLLERGDGSGLEYRIFTYSLKDNNMENIVVEDEEEYDKVFAIMIDKTKNTIIDRRLCSKGSGVSPTGVRWHYTIENVSLPYYCDKIDIHYYKQSSSEPEFTIKPQNFLGKARLYMPNITGFQRGSNTPLTVYDKDWNVTEDLEKSFLTRITPNYYTIESNITPSYERIGKIILPEGQENLMSEDEKIIPAQEFNKYTTTDNIKTNFNLYIPNEVTEFKFVVYGTTISDKKEDILYQYHIKLNRK